MTTASYAPPKVWVWDQESGGKFASINRPIAGPTHDKELPRGKHPFQLHSLATPNGVKVTVLFEELLAAGHSLRNMMHGSSISGKGINSVRVLWM